MSPRGAEGPVPESITYRLVMFRPLVFTGFSVLGLAAVAMVVNQLSGGVGPGPVFVAFWLAAYAWNFYGFFVLIGCEVGIVDGSILRWRSITRRREIPLARIKGLKTPFPPFGTGAMKIVVDGERSPLIMVSSGISDVVAMILQFRPDLVPQLDWYGRLAKRIGYPRAWGWRRV